MTTFNLHQLGVEALDIMNMRGWCRGTMFSFEGNVCATGALWLATGRDEEEALAITNTHVKNQAIYDWDENQLAPVFWKILGMESHNVWQWNDWNGPEKVRDTLANLPDVDVEL